MNKLGRLPNHVAEVRARLGLSQRDLAARSGVAVSTIHNVEAGTMDTLPETEYRIVAAFNDAEFERAPHDRRVWTPEIVFPDDRFIDVAEVPVPELGGYLASLGPGDVFSAFGTSDNARVVCYRKKAYGWTI